mgnify:CR=1 FL=1
MPYEHFTYYDRLDVQHGLRRGLSGHAIAKELSRSPSSITREIRRNRSNNGQYDAMKAQMQCRARQKSACRVHKLEHLPLRDYVKEKLQEEWSPGCIAEMLALEHPEDTRMRVSHETIYQYVYADKRQGGEPLYALASRTQTAPQARWRKGQSRKHQEPSLHRRTSRHCGHAATHR